MEVNSVQRETQGSIGITLDNFIDMHGFVPNHLKIDVDGLEDKVLFGSKNILKRDNLKSILVELSPINSNYIELIKYIESYGFKRVFPALPIDQIDKLIHPKKE